MDADIQNNIPAEAIAILARAAAPAMLAYFESEVGQAEFLEWKCEQGGDSECA